MLTRPAGHATNLAGRGHVPCGLPLAEIQTVQLPVTESIEVIELVTRRGVMYISSARAQRLGIHALVEPKRRRSDARRTHGLGPASKT